MNIERALSDFEEYDWAETSSGYFVVNLNKSSEEIGRSIISDLRCSDDEYCMEDVYARVENISDELRGSLIKKVLVFLEENW